MRLNRVILFLTLLITPSQSFSQSAVLNEGENSIGIFGGLDKSKDVVGRQATVIGSVAGYFDIGYFAGRVDLGENLADENIHGYLAQFHLVRNDDFSKSSAPNLIFFIQLAHAGSQKARSYGATVYFRRQKKPDSYFYLPGVSLSRTTGNNSQEAVYAYYFDITIGKRMGHNTIVSISPLIGVADNKQFFGIQGGITLVVGSLNKKK